MIFKNCLKEISDCGLIPFAIQHRLEKTGTHQFMANNSVTQQFGPVMIFPLRPFGVSLFQEIYLIQGWPTCGTFKILYTKSAPFLPLCTHTNKESETHHHTHHLAHCPIHCMIGGASWRWCAGLYLRWKPYWPSKCNRFPFCVQVAYIWNVHSLSHSCSLSNSLPLIAQSPKHKWQQDIIP